MSPRSIHCRYLKPVPRLISSHPPPSLLQIPGSFGFRRHNSRGADWMPAIFILLLVFFSFRFSCFTNALLLIFMQWPLCRAPMDQPAHVFTVFFSFHHFCSFMVAAELFDVYINEKKKKKRAPVHVS